MFSSQGVSPATARVPGRGAICALLALAFAGATLAGCSSDTARTLAVDVGYGPKTVAAPDFVAESRNKQTPDFMNVGIDAPRRNVRPKSTEGQKTLESELEGARGRNEARGRAAESAGKGTAKAAKPAPAPLKPAPAQPETN